MALGSLQIVLNNSTVDKAEALMLELQHSFGTSRHYPKVDVCFDATDYQQIGGADVVIVTAGKPRKDGQSRDDVLFANAAGTAEIGIRLKNVFEGRPEPLVISLANPADALCSILLQTTGFDPARVVAMTGQLDSARLHGNIADLFPDMPRHEIQTMMVGAHDNTMVPLLSQTFISNEPLAAYVHEGKISQAQIDTAIRETKNAGAMIIKLQGGSANIAPAHHAVQMTLDYLCGSGEEMVACRQVPAGFWGAAESVCIGVPISFNAEGAQIRGGIKPNSAEKEAFRVSTEGVIASNKMATAFLATHSNPVIAGAFQTKSIPRKAEGSGFRTGAVLTA